MYHIFISWYNACATWEFGEVDPNESVKRIKPYIHTHLPVYVHNGGREFLLLFFKGEG